MTIEEIVDDVVKEFAGMGITANIYAGAGYTGCKKYRVVAGKLKSSFQLFGTLQEVNEQWQQTKKTFKPS